MIIYLIHGYMYIYNKYNIILIVLIVKSCFNVCRSIPLGDAVNSLTYYTR